MTEKINMIKDKTNKNVHESNTLRNYNTSHLNTCNSKVPILAVFKIKP